MGCGECDFTCSCRLIFLRYNFNTVVHVALVRCPVLVLHSPDDDIIVFPPGEKVFQVTNEPESFVKMRGDLNNGFLISRIMSRP